MSISYHRTSVHRLSLESGYSSHRPSIDIPTLDSSLDRTVLWEKVAARGIAQDTNCLYVTDALDNSLKRFDKTRAKETDSVTHLTGLRRLHYFDEPVGGLCLVREGSMVAVTCGKRCLMIIDPTQKDPIQKLKLDYPDVPTSGEKDQIATFSSIQEVENGRLLVGFYGSSFVSELRPSNRREGKYEESDHHALDYPMRCFSYSAASKRSALSTTNDQMHIVDRDFRTLHQLEAPCNSVWEPWLCLLTDVGICFVNDRHGLTSILAFNAMDGSCLLKLVDEAEVYGWCFRHISLHTKSRSKRRGSTTKIESETTTPHCNSELIVYNSQVKSIERFLFNLSNPSTIMEES